MRPKKQTDIMYVLIPSFILVLAWIIFTVYTSAVSSTITDHQSANIKPISPTFELGILENLKQRKKVIPLMTQTAGTPSLASGSGQLQSQPEPLTLPQIQSATESTNASDSAVEVLMP